jgi:3-oxoacyl-[acyl-carrier protein] reductase
MTYEGKVALVTGGSRGIGQSIVRELSHHGAAVVFTHKSPDSLPESVSSGSSKNVLPVWADVRDAEKAHEVVQIAVERFGGLDILVNNAGVIMDRSLMKMSCDEWSGVIDTNLTGAFHYAKAALKPMTRSKTGRIIQISSVGAIRGMAGQVNYSASKAGLLGMTRALAREVAPFRITVNAVLPGYIETDMTAGASSDREESRRRAIPSSRFGHPEEVASLVGFLASDSAAYITGQAIAIDGGLSL